MPEFNYTRVIEGGGELWVCFASLIHRFNILRSILIEFQVGARSKLEFVWSTDFASWTVLLLFIQNNLVFLWERQWETIPNKSSVSQIYRHSISPLKEVPGKKSLTGTENKDTCLVDWGGEGAPWNFVRVYMRGILGIAISDLEDESTDPIATTAAASSPLCTLIRRREPSCWGF